MALVVVVASALGIAAMQRALDGLARTPFRLGDRVAVVGTLASDPTVSPFDTEALVRTTTFADDRVGALPRAVHRTLLVRASAADGARLATLEAGDGIVVRGEIAPLSGRAARSRWEHAVALLRRAHLQSDGMVRDPLLAIADPLRDRVLAGLRGLRTDDRALLGAFVLGDASGIDAATRDDFRAAGLSHLLVVSGANVAWTLAVVAPLRRRLPLAGRLVLGLAVVVVFCAMTRFEPSVLRASVMAAIVMAASAWGRPVRALRALSYAVIVLVLVDPFLVHSLGFWLSTGATVGIALFGTPLAARLPGPRVVRETTAISIAAQLGVLPALVLGGLGIPWIAPAANLLAVPVAEPITVLALPFAFVESWAPWLARPPLAVCALLLAWVRMVAHGAHTRPSVVAAGAAALVVVGVGFERRSRSRAPVASAA
jgi:competence protein ComEC